MKRATPPDRLARDAMAAQAAGMSYGKYKSLQYEAQQNGQANPFGEEPVPEEPEEEIMLDDDRRELTCQYCGKIFAAYGHEVRRKYCSDDCRSKGAYALWRARHPVVMVPCSICGKEMPRRSGKRYCSKACCTEGFRRKQEEAGGKPRKKRKKTDVQ